jgi:L-fuculose-phosphate aldolase
MPMDEETARQALVAAAQDLVRLGLNSGTVGNLSLRHGAGLLITPTGIAPDVMTADQIVAMDSAGNWQGKWAPSSEWDIHLRIMAARPDVGAVIHAHPDHCVALSCLRQPIPAFHYMVAGFGGDEVPCADYACFGSPELAETVVAALGPRLHGCLMANHGMVAMGPDLATALSRTAKLETLARQFLLARASGAPVLLTQAEMAAVKNRYKSYGKQPG